MNVLIVGGGSAGWITAALLDAALNNRGAAKRVHITLIESASIGRIGVGEATIPTMRRTLRKIGIPERDFLKSADATFKQAIRFVNWAKLEGHSYFHPFDRIQVAGRDQYGLRWLSSDRTMPFATTVSAQPALAMEGLAPKNADHKDYEGALSYAYHIDAEKFANYLCGLCVARGVTHIVDEVVDVEVNARGDILSVLTAGHQQVTADIFIDCSGFARILIGNAMGAGFESYADWLLCDRAVAMRIPYEASDARPEIRPYTTSTALSAGWCWDIGLQGRRGLGYVYSSAFLESDAAEQEFRHFVGAAEQIQARHLKFQSGRIRTPWIRNCVAIGLSAGFLEPLESTGIFFVEEAVDYLVELFPRLGRTEASARLFNRKMQDRYEECLDFINLHYCLTQRRDTPFWREVARPDRVTPRLNDMLERWEQKPPSRLDFTDSTQLFAHYNFEYILYGMGWAPAATTLPLRTARPPERAKIAVAEDSGRAALQHHSDFIIDFLAASKGTNNRFPAISRR